MIKGSLQVSIPTVKAFSAEIFCPVENCPKISVLGRNGCQNIKFSFRYPKRHILARKDVILRIEHKIGVGVSAVEAPNKMLSYRRETALQGAL